MTEAAHFRATQDALTGRQRYSLFAPVAAWAVESYLGAAVTGEAAAENGAWAAFTPWVLGGVTVVLLLAAVAGFVVAMQDYRAARRQPEALSGDARNPAQMLAIAAMVLSATLSVGILWAGLPLLIVDPAVRAH